jgi:hypothetical protein
MSNHDNHLGTAATGKAGPSSITEPSIISHYQLVKGLWMKLLRKTYQQLFLLTHSMVLDSKLSAFEAIDYLKDFN